MSMRHCPSIVELSEHRVIEGNPRRKQALQLASEHDIDPATAYNIVDEKIYSPRSVAAKTSLNYHRL